MDKKTTSNNYYQENEAREEERKRYERMRIFTGFLNYIRKKQSKPNQPIYVIVENWLSEITSVERFSCDGEDDRDEMIKIFNEKFKHGDFGVTEAGSGLYKITIERIE